MEVFWWTSAIKVKGLFEKHICFDLNKIKGKEWQTFGH